MAPVLFRRCIAPCQTSPHRATRRGIVRIVKVSIRSVAVSSSQWSGADIGAMGRSRTE
jgi:hypothetical protein